MLCVLIETARLKLINFIVFVSAFEALDETL